MGLGLSVPAPSADSWAEPQAALERVVSSTSVPLDDVAWVQVLSSRPAPSLEDARKGDSAALFCLAQHAARHNGVSKNGNTLLAHLVLRMRNARAASNLDRRSTETCVFISEHLVRAFLQDLDAATLFGQLASGPNLARAPDTSLMQRGGNDVMAGVLDYIGARIASLQHHDLKIRAVSFALVAFGTQLLEADVDASPDSDPFLAAALALGRGADPISLETAQISSLETSAGSHAAPGVLESRSAKAIAARAARAHARLAMPRAEADPPVPVPPQTHNGKDIRHDLHESLGGTETQPLAPLLVPSRAACVVAALLTEVLSPTAPPPDSRCEAATRASTTLIDRRAQEAERRRNARLAALRRAREHSKRVRVGEGGSESGEGNGTLGEAARAESYNYGLLGAGGAVLDFIEGTAWSFASVPFTVAQYLAGGMSGGSGGAAGLMAFGVDSYGTGGGSRMQSDLARQMLEPLPLRSLLLLLLLVHNVGTGGSESNPFAQAIASLRDIRYMHEDENDDSEGAISIHDDGMRQNSATMADGLSDSIDSRAFSPSHAVVADFGKLFEALVAAVDTPLGPLLLYTLLTTSPRFRAFCLARSDLALLVAPLCRQLAYPVHLRTGELYVLVVLVLRLTEDYGVCAALHAISDSMADDQKVALARHAGGSAGGAQAGTGSGASAAVMSSDPSMQDAEAGASAALDSATAGDSQSAAHYHDTTGGSQPPAGGRLILSVGWYTDRVLLDISPGSLLLLALLRAAHHNAAARTDAFLATHLLAAASNMGPHVAGVHPFVADRATRFMRTLCRRAGEAKTVISRYAQAQQRPVATSVATVTSTSPQLPNASVARSAAEDLRFILPQMRELAALLRLFLRPSRARYNLPIAYALLCCDDWWHGVLPVVCIDGGILTDAAEELQEMHKLKLSPELEPLWQAASSQVAGLFESAHIFRTAVEIKARIGSDSIESPSRKLPGSPVVSSGSGTSGPPADTAIAEGGAAEATGLAEATSSAEARGPAEVPRRFLSEAEVNDTLLETAVRMARARDQEAGLLHGSRSAGGRGSIGLPLAVSSIAARAGPVRAQHFAYAAKDDPEQFYVPFIWEGVAESTPDLGWSQLATGGLSRDGSLAADGEGTDRVLLIDLSDLGLQPDRKVIVEGGQEGEVGSGGALQVATARGAVAASGAGGGAGAALSDGGVAGQDESV